MTRPLLNFLDYHLARLRVEPESSFAPDIPPRAQIQVSFAVGRDPEAMQRFEVTLNVSIYKGGPDENVAYITDFAIIGEFWANVVLTPGGVPAVLVLNALSQLYGVARGIVGQTTAGGINDRFVLPSITFDDLVRKATADPISNVITDDQHNELAAREDAQRDTLDESATVARASRTAAATDNEVKVSMEFVARLHGVLLSLQQFDNTEVRPKVNENVDHTVGEDCTIGTYLRSLANVRTLVLLKNAGNFQAIAMIARALFELAVDIRLLQHIPDAAERVMAFAQVEKLRAARRTVANIASTESEPSEVHERFIEEHATEIEAKAQIFWPKHKRPPHWSGLDLRSRARLLKAPFDAMYDSHYQELSWYVHTGLTGIAGLEAYVFPLICGKAYEVAIESYRETLRSAIEQLNLRDADPQIDKKLELARLLPFTSGAREAAQLRHELLGQ